MTLTTNLHLPTQEVKRIICATHRTATARETLSQSSTRRSENKGKTLGISVATKDTFPDFYYFRALLGLSPSPGPNHFIQPMTTQYELQMLGQLLGNELFLKSFELRKLI